MRATPTPFTITRAIDASPQRVFEAWTEPDQAGWWFGPDAGWSAPPELIAMDLRPGGRWRVTLVDACGNEYPSVLVYREVVEGERLAFATAGTSPAEPVTTVTFTDRDGGTQQTFQGYAGDLERDEIARDWSLMFDRLAAQVTREPAACPTGRLSRWTRKGPSRE